MKPTENPSDCNIVTACYTPNTNHHERLQPTVTAQNFCYSNNYPVTPTTPTTLNQGEKCNNTPCYVTPPPQQQKKQKVTPVTPCNPVTGGIC